jgi:ectoine hydroxylase-related dioxygenase (phytanoyl-CoA dioxygenase family)
MRQPHLLLSLPPVRRRLRALGRHTRGPTASAAAAGPLTVPPPLPTRAAEADENGSVVGAMGERDWWRPEVAAGVYRATGGSNGDAEALAAEVYEHGFAVVRQAMPLAWVDECAAAFTTRLDAHIARIGASDPATRNRGAHRHYIELPLCSPFVDITDQPLLGAALARLFGPEAAAERFASDTPLGVGSEYQSVHLDVGQAGPWDAVTGRLCQRYEAEQLVWNWPLVDVTEDNGPMEIAPGASMLSQLSTSYTRSCGTTHCRRPSNSVDCLHLWN